MQTERARRAYGSGSIFERNGDWYGKWRVAGRQVKRKLGPKRTRGEADGLTRTQAEARLRELIAEVRAGDVQHAPSATRRKGWYTVAELSALYIEHARETRGLKEATTLKDYAATTRNHFAPFFGERPIQRIDPALIERFVKHLRSTNGKGRRGGKPLSPKTVENYLTTLGTLFNFAVKKRWIAASPMLGVERPVAATTDAPIAELNFLEPHEVAGLAEAARPGEYHELDRALYLLAAYSGLRQGELRGLRWRHIDFGCSTIHVLESVTRGTRSSPKGKRRRAVPLAPSAAQALLVLRAVSRWTAPDAPVFACPSTGGPMARAGLMRRYRQALEAAGLPVEFCFHDLRHTFGTTMARAGESLWRIQEWMGHADVETTKLYLHYAPAVADAAIIERAFGSGTNPGTNLSLAGGTEVTSANEQAA